MNASPPLAVPLNRFDRALLCLPPAPALTGIRRFLAEFVLFGIKEARACLFVGLFFLSVFAVPRAGLWHIPRYDLLLVIALAIQAAMLATKLESWDEFKAICLFHAVGFLLELVKTSGDHPSWTYGDFAYSKIAGVPLFAGFMYAAIGSYIIQAWRLLDLRIRHHPPYWMAITASLAIYVNFFTNRLIGDYRWYLAALVLGLYARSTITFRPYDRDRQMPLLLGFILIGFFIWLAENISTFFGLWHYPNQLGAWSTVHIGKWSSWTLMVIMSFTIIATLKHFRTTIHIPK